MQIHNEIVKLLEDVRHGCGMLTKRVLTEDYTEPDNSKIELKIVGDPSPGCRVKIFWDWKALHSLEDDDECEYPPDEGYIFTLPGNDSNDIWMAGIVHIPRPEGCEKCECDPEWTYISRLLANSLVKRIQFYAS